MTDAAEDREQADLEERQEADDPVEVPTAYDVPVTESCGQRVLHPAADQYIGVVEALGTDGFNQCLDVCGVDYLTHPGRSTLPSGVQPERFEVVATFISHAAGERIRLRVQLPAADPTLASLFDLYPGTEAMEREAFDMFGIGFEGHPDLTRILMPEDWSGHPLRKDFAVGTVPVQFKAAPAAR
jgi:NADH-quinone oxidoreductase subunit C